MSHLPRTTPLHEAARRGDRAKVVSLLRRGTPVDIRASDGRPWVEEGVTALHVAARYRNPGVVRALLRAGANANGVTEDGGKADFEADVDEEAGPTPLHEAAYRGHTEVVLALLTAGALRNPLAHGEGFGPPLPPHPFCLGGTFTPLHFAAECGHVDVVRALLEAGADLNKRAGDFRRTPLHVAAERGHGRVVDALLEARADVDIRDDTGGSPVAWASTAYVVEALLASGADPDLEVSCGSGAWTPLGYHCLFTSLTSDPLRTDASVAMMELLLSYGADTRPRVCYDASSSASFGAIHGSLFLTCAARNGVPEIVSLLLDYGLDPNELDEKSGMSPVHEAARLGRHEALRVLLSAGGDPNAPTRTSGSTPLHLACRLARLESVRELLRRGAKPTIREGGPGGTGPTPEDIIGADLNTIRRSDGQRSLGIHERKAEMEAIRVALWEASPWYRRGPLILLKTCLEERLDARSVQEDDTKGSSTDKPGATGKEGGDRSSLGDSSRVNAAKRAKGTGPRGPPGKKPGDVLRLFMAVSGEIEVVFRHVVMFL